MKKQKSRWDNGDGISRDEGRNWKKGDRCNKKITAKELMGFGIIHRSRVREPGRNLEIIYFQWVDLLDKWKLQAIKWVVQCLRSCYNSSEAKTKTKFFKLLVHAFLSTNLDVGCEGKEKKKQL